MPRPYRFENSGRTPEFVRFLLAGILNTAVGYGAYLLLEPALGRQPAFAAAYAIGIILAFLVNSRFVFRTSMTLRKALAYPLVYLGSYLASAMMLAIATDVLAVDHRWAAIAALVAGVPVSFVLNRVALRNRPSRSS